MQFIPIYHFVFAPPTMTCRDMDVMFDDYLNHMVPKEIQGTIDPKD